MASVYATADTLAKYGKAVGTNNVGHTEREVGQSSMSRSLESPVALWRGLFNHGALSWDATRHHDMMDVYCGSKSAPDPPPTNAPRPPATRGCSPPIPPPVSPITIP
ncbi:unnamed protein product [Arctogadus glacialis]